MCGIAGIASLRGSPPDPAAIGPMLACVAHRGPDDEGVFRAGGVLLGHRRLSIIDVEGGHQPLFGARPGTAIVVNGELYNYRELREELQRAGHVFRTRSDSEVAAHAYDQWGDAFLERLDGMFALALWDAARGRLLLARDRMGEKPLFYALRGDLLLFASELSALLAHPAVAPELDPVALTEYLALEYVPAPHSIIRDVHKLEPGAALALERGQLVGWRYWRIDLSRRSTLSYPDAVAELRLRLERAVTSRLVSDVPLGIFLSGGIDSSTVAALAARAGSLETFAIGFEERSFDERSWARAVAAHIGANHHEEVVSGSDLAGLAPTLGEWLDEPIGDASILPTAALSRFARRHVTVALGGDGGDELFAGYPMHQAHRLTRATGRWPRPLVGAVRGLARALPVSHANFAFRYKVEAFARGAGARAPHNHLCWLSSFAPAEQRRLLQPGVLHAAAGAELAFRTPLARWQESEGAPLLARATHLDATTYLPNDILVKVDRASMAVALEVRAPLLAADVVSFAFSLPDAFRMRALTGKRILRDAVRDLLPEAVLERPKKGFGMPVAAWLNGPLAPLVDDVLSPAAIARGGIFRPAEVARLIEAHRARRADHRKVLWTLLVLELWRTAHGVELPAALGRAA